MQLKIILDLMPLVSSTSPSSDSLLVPVGLDQFKKSLFGFIKLFPLLSKLASKTYLMVDHVLQTSQIVIVLVDGRVRHRQILDICNLFRGTHCLGKRLMGFVKANLVFGSFLQLLDKVETSLHRNVLQAISHVLELLDALASF